MAGSSIASLIVSMIADTAGFTTDMTRTAKQQTARMKQMEKEAQAAGRALGLAFTAAAVAMGAVVKSSTATADQMQKLSQRTGLSTEALSRYAYVTGLADVEIETFTKGVGKMQRSLVDADNGLKTQQRAFDRLGLSVSELLKLSPEQQFEEIAGAISSLESATLRAATAQEIFGRGGVQLLSVMQGGKAGIQAIKDEAESFNLVISQNFADSSAQFNDNMTRIGKIAEGTGNAFTQGILPALLDVQAGFLGMSRNFDVFRAAGEKVGAVIRVLANAFVIVKESALLFGRVLLGSVLAVFNAIRAAVTPITGAILALGSAMQKLAAGDFAGALEAIKDVPATIAREFEIASQKMRTAAGFLTEQFTDEIPAALARLNKFFNAHETVVDSTVGAYGDMEDQTKKSSAATKEWSNRQKAASALIRENIEYVESLEQAHEEYNKRLQDFIDIGDPIAALVREFGEQVAFANLALSRGDITIEEYRRSLNALSDELGRAAAGTQQVAEETSVMTIAMDESIRILERAFTDLWSNILDGGNSVWDGLFDGFKTMLANIFHQLSTGRIVEQLRNLFDPEKVFDLKEFGAGLAATIGAVIGSELGGGGTGADIGALLGGAVGSVFGPIGTALGSILGGLAGGLFDSNRPSIFEASGRSNANLSRSDDDNVVDTIFGRTFLRSRRLDQAAINEFKDALIAFDNSIGSFLDDIQVSAISDVLKEWSQRIEGETLTAEELLNSRFAAILTTFTADIQNFVNQAQDLEEKAARLQIGVGVEKLFAEKPDLFGQHTVREFLAVVDAFKDGTDTIADAFNQVLQLLDTIVSVKTALKDFATSNLAEDFALVLERQSEGVIGTLTRLTSGLSDAITNFDGSPEQLVEIGNLALSVRQQELAALSLIDSVAKGLKANLDRLRSDVNTTINGPRAAEEILLDARALIGKVSLAQSPEEIAAIGQEFEALIRSLSPEDTKAFGSTINALIDSFDAVSAEASARLYQAVIDSGADIRAMAGNFEALIDPIQIIADTNERAAAALEAIATGTAVVTVMPVQDIALADPVGQTAVISQGINEALTAGVDEMGVAIQNAIIRGFGAANVTVNVVVQDQGLVTQ